MTSPKEQQQSQVNDPRADNRSIKSLLMYKDFVRSTDYTIDDLIQAKQYLSKECTNFVICRDCFWCASVLSSKYFLAKNCPSCSLDMLEAIPIAQNEKFEISHDTRRGLTLEFSIRSQ